jgi:predicted short-subunit dehydrogenase-like oxidoreductase (DUF2520 family)
MPPKKHELVIVGCGNLAWHLAKRLSGGHYSIAVHNHKANTALEKFAAKLNCRTSSTLKDVASNAAYYILAVPDDKIESTASDIQVTNPRALMIHCSGSMPLSALGKRVHGTAVLYPVQTFTAGDEVDWTEVPIAVEASDTSSLKKLTSLANALSPWVMELDSAQRLKLHMNAVLVSNFPNALYAAAQKLTKKNGIDFRVLMPLIKQTTAKLDRLTPLKAQTGPAKRKDKAVLKKHRRLLRHDKPMERIYRLLSKLIQEQQAV